MGERGRVWQTKAPRRRVCFASAAARPLPLAFSVLAALCPSAHPLSLAAVDGRGNESRPGRHLRLRVHLFLWGARGRRGGGNDAQFRSGGGGAGHCPSGGRGAMGQGRAEGTRCLPSNALVGRCSPDDCAGGRQPQEVAAKLPPPTQFRTSARSPPPESLPIVCGRPAVDWGRCPCPPSTVNTGPARGSGGVGRAVYRVNRHPASIV